MLYIIEDKNISIKLLDEKIKIPQELRIKINENFQKIKNEGANIWNGEILCVAKNHIDNNELNIICKKSDFAHYLYGEKIGLPDQYCCRNLSAGCLLETIDGYLVLEELDETVAYPHVLQIPGGNIDKADIIDYNINIENTIIRETLEEININLKDEKQIIYHKIKYMYISEENEQPGVQLLSKAKINMSKEDLKKYFEQYYQYLKRNNLELEVKRLHFLKKEKALEEYEKLNNPKREYLVHLIEADVKNSCL